MKRKNSGELQLTDGSVTQQEIDELFGSIGALSEEYERTNEEWKSIVELCQMEDAASTAQLRALANKHGVENVSTLNKRGLCHMFAMLWEKDHDGFPK